MATTLKFSQDPTQSVDFTKVSPSEIYATSVGSFMDLVGVDPGGLLEASEKREKQSAEFRAEDVAADQSDDAFLANLFQEPLPRAEDVLDAPEGSEPIPDTGGDSPAVDASDLAGFVKTFEGFNPNSYEDYKQRSIGYGTKARKGETSISREEATKRLGAELSNHRNRVVSHAKKHGYKFTPNQLDALTSFDYNTGSISKLTDNGKRTTKEIADAMLLYNKAGGKTLKGLVRRRKAEQSLFLKGY